MKTPRGVARRGGEAVRGHSRQREKWLRQEKVGGKGRGGVATGIENIVKISCLLSLKLKCQSSHSITAILIRTTG